MLTKTTTVFAMFLAGTAFGGVITSGPEYQLPGGTTVPSALSPIPTGPNSFFWPSDFLSFDQTGTAVFYFSTDAASGQAVYTLAMNFSNQTGDAWSSIRYEIVADGDDSSVFLVDATTGDDVVIKQALLPSGFSSDETIMLGFGSAAPPQQFQLRMTPSTNIPEPGTAFLIASGGVAFLRRRRRQ